MHVCLLSVRTTERPKCSDDVTLTEGETTPMTCTVEFQGAMPRSVGWFRDGAEVDADAETEVAGARSVHTSEATLTADWTLDGAEFVCKLMLEEETYQCSTHVTVKCKCTRTHLLV